MPPALPRPAPAPGALASPVGSTALVTAGGQTDAVLLRALGADPDDSQPLITSTEGLDIKSESGSSTRSR